MNLLEEKHKEEKRLYEIKLAQASQKFSVLGAQLNNQQANKNQLVEQLHSVMQKQWQQALKIVSGGNTDILSPFQRLNVEKLLEYPVEGQSKNFSKPSGVCHPEPMKLESTKNRSGLPWSEFQNESFFTLTSHDETPVTSRKDSSHDLKRYVKMVGFSVCRSQKS